MHILNELKTNCKEAAIGIGELVRDVSSELAEGVREFAESPGTYSLEAIHDIADFASGMAFQDCVNIPVEPVVGSVVYCRLLGGIAEHSGIYVGDGKIVHLNSNGYIQVVNDTCFADVTNGLSFPGNIYVASRFCKAVGKKDIAKRALEKVGKLQGYQLLTNNCHRFVSGCITGEFDNADFLMWALKDTCKKRLGASTWNLYKKC